MTNEEIKTALNCCMEWTANGGKTNCTNCPMDKNKPCHVNLHLEAVKRIKELEAANKKLQDEVDSLCNENDGLELRTESLDEQLTRKTRQLESENAALRERLEKAVELPCKVGDTIYSLDHFDLKIRENKVIAITFLLSNSVNHLEVQAHNFRGAVASFESIDFGKDVFTDRSAAEARLAELKGGKDG